MLVESRREAVRRIHRHGMFVEAGIMFGFDAHGPEVFRQTNGEVDVFVAGMGARATVAGFAQAPAFLLGAFIWIFIHGAFCLAGAKLFRVDVHSAAIASAANIGAAASAPIVAAFHRPSLVPVSILMALIGYALGNYLAPLAAHLARMAVGQ